MYLHGKNQNVCALLRLLFWRAVGSYIVSACFPVAVVAEMTSKCAANKENVPLSRRFNLLDVDDDDFEIMPNPFQPKNTQLSTSWGLKTFADG